MNRDNPDASTNAFPVLSVFRGIYQRVAAKLGVDPSFVSRVARGERRSPAVLAALREEMSVIRAHLSKLDESLGDDRPLDRQQKNGRFSDGELLDGHARDGQSRKSAVDGGELLDGHLKDSRVGANSSDGPMQSKPSKPNSKSFKSRQK